MAEPESNQNKTTNAVEDVPQQIDIDPGAMLERIDAWVDGTIRLLPNLALAVILILIVYFLAGFVSATIQKNLQKKDRKNLGEMLGGFARWGLIILGVLLGATIVFPGLNPADLIAGLGVSSVAIGFAFKDILQNWLAGLLILIRQPFEIGDQIVVGDYEGTVEHIETRATLIKTYDSQRAVIPNSQIYTSAVLVKTAHEKRRSQYDIGIGYADNIDIACETILGAIRSVDQIELDPAPQALPWDLAASWVTIRARWWTDTKRADIVKARADVIKAIKEALDEQAIDMPYDTKVHLFHDQTETTDGDRAAQREGWPTDKEQHGTTPRWQAEEKAKKPDEAAEKR